MHEIKRVVILGAGAIGAVYASKFFQAAGLATSLLAGGTRYDRLRREGLVVNGQMYRIPVRHVEDEAAPPADLVLVAVKFHHLPQAIRDLRRVIGKETVILSVMNGLDSEEMLGAAYGPDKVLYAVSVGMDGQRQGNRITYTNAGKIVFGEADNRQISPRVRRVQAAFDRAGIAYETPPDMLRAMWWKFMVNVGMNQASAVLRAPYSVFQTMPEAQALMESLMREVVALAPAEGVHLAEQDIAGWYPILHRLAPQGQTSMLQDIEAGRKTEVEMFAGKVVALGEKHGIPTPVNETLLRLIRVLEQMAAA